MASNTAIGALSRTRASPGRVVPRHVLYLGEINDTQELAWQRSIGVLEEGAAQPRTLSLFPEDRCARVLADASIVQVQAVAVAVAPATAVGCVLAGAAAVARAAAPSVLVETAGRKP
jgi:hypothetical protein